MEAVRGKELKVLQLVLKVVKVVVQKRCFRNFFEAVGQKILGKK